MIGRPLAAWLLLGLGCAAVAAAATSTAADAVIELYCETGGAKHPKKITLVAPVGTGDFAALPSGRLLVGYDPDGRPGKFTGKMKVRATLHRADGTSLDLGKLSTVQNGGNGAALAEKTISVAPAPGDQLEWRFTFKKFEPLAAGECFVLIAGLQPPAEGCGPYPDWSSSDYVLPYRPGTSQVVSQGNCSLGSHRGDARHAYDVAMPPGTEIVAARAGEVVAVDDSSPDGTGLFEHDNAVVIEHDDGTLASYVHTQQGGALVSLGEQVAQGQPIALSGNSGHTSDLPHLHFQVTACGDRRLCGTEPVTFRNTRANPDGLELGGTYRAQN